MDKPATNLPQLFPVQITMRVDGLLNNDQTQNCRAMVVYPDGWSFSGTAVILRDGQNLSITFVGQK